MKIDSSHIKLSAKRNYFQKQEISIEQRIRFSGLFDQQLERLIPQSDVGQPHKRFSSDWVTATRVNGLEAVQLSQGFIAELEKLRQILGAVLDRVNSKGCDCCSLDIAGLGPISLQPFQRPPVSLFEYNYFEKTSYLYQEKESTDFFADGVVNTADGRSIDFSFQMNLDRQYFKQDQFVHQEKGYVMIDPLVINLDAGTPQISNVSMGFDLNMDGEDEQISILKPGSGFLSLDKNNDGVINDGSELFGPATGNGFGELGQYDQDHNFWIDENDPIFDELTLWGGNNEGQMQLTRIKDAGIGAIYLDTVESSFDLRDDNNDLTARIKKSGVALNEDGSVSSIQEMDWTG